MLSFLRSDVPRRTTSAHQNPIVYEGDRGSKQVFHNPSASYMMTHTIPPSTPASDGKQAFRSMFNPPTHFHMYQLEKFHVVSGKARFYIEGHTHDRNEDEGIFIPIGSYHRFENSSLTEDLVIDIRLDEQNWVMEEKFFRNFFGYLGDCLITKTEPSILQLLLFLYVVGGPLAVPVPGPRWIGRFVSWLLMYVAGVIVGEHLLGYQRSYVEYYVGGDPTKKEL